MMSPYVKSKISIGVGIGAAIATTIVLLTALLAHKSK